eukprot:scaffold78201_cov46-Phaeocystis_antarctica.AAC.1
MTLGALAIAFGTIAETESGAISNHDGYYRTLAGHQGASLSWAAAAELPCLAAAAARPCRGEAVEHRWWRQVAVGARAPAAAAATVVAPGDRAHRTLEAAHRSREADRRSRRVEARHSRHRNPAALHSRARARAHAAHAAHAARAHAHAHARVRARSPALHSREEAAHHTRSPALLRTPEAALHSRSPALLRSPAVDLRNPAVARHRSLAVGRHRAAAWQLTARAAGALGQLHALAVRPREHQLQRGVELRAVGGHVARALARKLDADAGLVLDVLEVGALGPEQLAAYLVARRGVKPHLDHLARRLLGGGGDPRRRRRSGTVERRQAHAAPGRRGGRAGGGGGAGLGHGSHDAADHLLGSGHVLLRARLVRVRVRVKVRVRVRVRMRVRGTGRANVSRGRVGAKVSRGSGLR